MKKKITELVVWLTVCCRDIHGPQKIHQKDNDKKYT